MALFRLYIQKQCRIISSRHILHPNLNYKKESFIMENYYKLPVAVWENGNVPSVTDTITCFCIGFGKNINGQKHILLPPPYSYITFPNHSPLSVFLQFIPSCLLYRYCCRVHRIRHYHPSFDSPSDRRVCFFPSSISAPVCYGW